MFDGSTPSPEPAPFAVGYGNGYGYESLPTVTPTRGEARRPSSPRWGEGGPATAAMTAAMTIDPDATVAIPTPVAAPASVAPVSVAPYVAHPVGAAHPRRRFGRGLVLAGVALLVAGTGVGAAALVTGAEVQPASAASTSSNPAALATASTAGGQLGRGVQPHGGPATVDPSIPVPVSIIEPVTTIYVPKTAPSTTTPPTTAPPTTTPPTTTPPTTTPPTTTPPTTTPPVGPTFTTLAVPSTVDCPTPDTDALATFSWSAPGATKVTLSIDGPGVYRTYNGAAGTETVSFPCSSSHTYLFTAYGSGGAVTTKSFTVAPS